MNIRPSTLSQKLNNAGLMQYVEQIITAMRKRDDLFSHAIPTLDTVDLALSAFRQAATYAMHRDQRAIRIRNEKRKKVEYLLLELAKYVDTVANKNDNTVLASGFALSKKGGSYAGPVSKPSHLIMQPQEVGSCRVRLKVDRWKGARMYAYQYRKKGVENAWTTQLSSRSSFIIEGLEKFQEYEFRITYVGINPEPNYSDIVSSYVV